MPGSVEYGGADSGAALPLKFEEEFGRQKAVAAGAATN